MVKGVLDPGRRQGVPVVHIAVSVRSDYADAPAHPRSFRGSSGRVCTKAGTPGAGICDELKPRAGDALINKHCAGPPDRLTVAAARSHKIQKNVVRHIAPDRLTGFVVKSVMNPGVNAAVRFFIRHVAKTQV